jgi:hypothetical protein
MTVPNDGIKVVLCGPGSLKLFCAFIWMTLIRRTLAVAILSLAFLLIISHDALLSFLAPREVSLSYIETPKSLLYPSTSTSTLVETSISGSEHVTGFSLFDRLYLRNGTFFIVTGNISAFPQRSNMIAPANDLGVGDTRPTDKVY